MVCSNGHNKETCCCIENTTGYLVPRGGPSSVENKSQREGRRAGCPLAKDAAVQTEGCSGPDGDSAVARRFPSSTDYAVYANHKSVSCSDDMFEITKVVQGSPFDSPNVVYRLMIVGPGSSNSKSTWVKDFFARYSECEKIEDEVVVLERGAKVRGAKENVEIAIRVKCDGSEKDLFRKLIHVKMELHTPGNMAVFKSGVAVSLLNLRKMMEIIFGQVEVQVAVHASSVVGDGDANVKGKRPYAVVVSGVQDVGKVVKDLKSNIGADGANFIRALRVNSGGR